MTKGRGTGRKVKGGGKSRVNKDHRMAAPRRIHKYRYDDICAAELRDGNYEAVLAKKTVPDEFSDTLTHAKGMLSMGKFDEPNTGTSSFSMLLGYAPFLDQKYTIFGRVVAGDFVLSQLEKLETVRDGIFVKPKQRVEIVSAVVMYSDGDGGLVLDEAERRKSEL